MPAQHTANLALRFALEIASLVIAGMWAWRAALSWPVLLRLALVIAVPLFMAVLWGVFRVPGDPPGKTPPVRVPGLVRLALELAFFGFALWAAFAGGRPALGWSFGAALLIHHLWSIRRIAWLAGQ